MKILVTGSGGVLGHALQTIAQEYSEVEFIFSRSLSCDLTKIKQTYEYVESLQPDAIMHLAAVSGGVKLSMDHPAMLLRDNVLMTINILEASQFIRMLPFKCATGDIEKAKFFYVHACYLIQKQFLNESV